MKPTFSPFVSLSLCMIIISASLCRAEPSRSAPEDRSALVKELKATRSADRARAAEALGRLGPLAAPAVPALIEALDDRAVAVRFEAAMALSHIGPAARAAVPRLTQILKEDEPKLYAAAMEALGAIGHDSAEAAPALITFLEGDDLVRAPSAGCALARILPEDSEELRRAVPVLVKSLKTKRSAGRGDAQRCLAEVGPAAIPALVTLIEDEKSDPTAAVGAEIVLEWMRGRAQSAVPTLVRALGSGNPEVVMHAAEALAAIGPAGHEGLSELQQLLGSKSADVRAHAAHALGHYGPAARGAVESLVKTLQDHNEHVRRESAEALGLIGPDAKNALPALIATLNDSVGSVTMHAVQAIAQIGPSAVPAVIPVLKDQKLRRLAVLVLGELGPHAKAAVPELVKLLSDSDAALAQDVVLALSSIGPAAGEAAPQLMDIVSERENKLRAAAAFALGSIGARQAIPLLAKTLEQNDLSDPKMGIVVPAVLVLLDPENEKYVQLALPRLIEGLTDKSELVQRQSAAALRQIGPRAASAVPKLAAGLGKVSPPVRVEFLWTLAAIGPAAAPALPEVAEALAAAEPRVRNTACYAAGMIGPLANEVVPALEKNLQEHDDFLKFTSAWALVHINPRASGATDVCLLSLINGLKLSDPRARTEAAQALALLGARAKEAVPVLTKAATDDDEKSVREAAADALQKIRGSE